MLYPNYFVKKIYLSLAAGGWLIKMILLELLYILLLMNYRIIKKKLNKKSY